jgi:tagaturonate reductase
MNIVLQQPLNYTALTNLNEHIDSFPDSNYLQLPEKILQFGTGVLLRGLCDHYIDMANKQNVFNGRIAVVKSTNGGNEFESQNNLYTVCLRGKNENGNVEQNHINGSISRVLLANTQWQEIMNIAKSADVEIVLSNTTEVGIVYEKENILDFNITPNSYPAKLTQLLLNRYQFFNGDVTKGWIILPTELVTNNGDLLKKVIIQHIEENQLDDTFKFWVLNACNFCNTLVDRIVPGKPAGSLLESINNKLPYHDDLKLVAELFNLWAIQGNDSVKEKLSFAKLFPEIIIENDIDIYRELKLRMLNGSHTFHCGLAHLAGFTIVREALQNQSFLKFANNLIYNEIASAIPYNIPEDSKKQFGDSLIFRFLNPYLEHKWLDITLHYSSKMKMRNIAVIQNYFKLHQTVPKGMAVGFAAYILFMKCTLHDDGKYYGISNGKKYFINDVEAAYFAKCFANNTEIETIVESILANELLWGCNLNELPNWTSTIVANIKQMQLNGAMELINNFK